MKKPDFYYSESEWDRLGCGPLPDERNRQNKENRMTTFTSEDRANATKYVDEAPYHPGYEDAVILKNDYQDILSTEDCMLGDQLNLDLPHTENENILLRKRILELEKELEEYRSYKTRHFNTAQGIIDFLKS